MDRQALLERYRIGYDAVVEALAGATDEDLDRKPPDGWTARMAVHHLADSEATAYVRLRRIVAEEDPLIVGYDEELFSRRLHYDRPIERSLAVLAAVRESSLELLESLTPGRMGASRAPLRFGSLLGRRLVAHLCGALARPRRPDPTREARGVLEMVGMVAQRHEGGVPLARRTEASPQRGFWKGPPRPDPQV